ncbi:uncharacterized protein LOC111409390 [Olea europaea var. sylvestris]|uniref:uncharacterized protein LOC111409390 n=1 Tax=Olea europaea var. sylvestris TaxID=158386 RepID=UPI000C1D6F9B|nr:uncharacterized protein LOC111409390 [Olea europaea var. sylvestris]
MPELAFLDLRSGFRTRDMSPDSVIFTGESNFSIFSSASASVDRCSFASDLHDQDSLASEVSQHLAGRDFSESSSGPDPDPNKLTLALKNNDNLSRKPKAKVHKLESREAETIEDENLTIDSARNSFSLALKECKDRRSRSEALLKKADRRRPASLDLNNSTINVANSSSPRYGVMKKPSVTTSRTGTFPSPGTPNYRHVSVGMQKGWSSERVPLHTNANKRHVNTVFLPYNSGRTLPSKWEDAERWIFSPMTGDGAGKPSVQQPQRRPKSKSGPLGPPGVAYYQLFSPIAPTIEGGHAQKLVADSPFSAGMIAADGLSIQYGGSGNFPIGTEPSMARSISIHGCSEMLSQSMFPSHQGTISLPCYCSPNVYVNIDMTRYHFFYICILTSCLVSSCPTLPFKDKTTEIACVFFFGGGLQKAKAEAAIRKLEMKLEKKRSSSMDKIMNKLRSAQKKAQEMRSSALANQANPVAKTSSKAISFRRTRPVGSLSGCFTCHVF